MRMRQLTRIQHARSCICAAAGSAPAACKPALEIRVPSSIRHPPARPATPPRYGFVSVAITLFNRAVFSVYQFNFPSTVTLLQILVSLAFMYALRAAGAMQFGALTWRGARKVRRERAVASGPGRRPGPGVGVLAGRPSLFASSAQGCGASCKPNDAAAANPFALPGQVAPLAVFWWLYVVSGVTALRHLNVPMFRFARKEQPACFGGMGEASLAWLACLLCWHECRADLL